MDDYQDRRRRGRDRGLAVLLPAVAPRGEARWCRCSSLASSGGGSIVTRNTFYRIMGWQVPANMPDPDVIDVTPISLTLNQKAGLDDEMLREIGRYG